MSSPHDMAVDADGNPLPCSPAEIAEIIRKAAEEDNLVAAVFRMPSGDLSVQVFGPPSQELLEILETATRAFRRVLKGHG